MKLFVNGISTDWCRKVWDGGRDDYGQLPIKMKSYGPANPCRHCLRLIEPGSSKLVLAYRPFEQKQPYAETGPIFLHSEPCQHYRSTNLPAWFEFLDPAILRGYTADHWIRYETGKVVAGTEIAGAVLAILSDSEVAYVHVRSKFNCFQCRIDRVAAGTVPGSAATPEKTDQRL